MEFLREDRRWVSETDSKKLSLMYAITACVRESFWSFVENKNVLLIKNICDALKTVLFSNRLISKHRNYHL